MNLLLPVGVCWGYFQAQSEEAVERHSGTKERAWGAECPQPSSSAGPLLAWSDSTLALH